MHVIAVVSMHFTFDAKHSCQVAWPYSCHMGMYQDWAPGGEILSSARVWFLAVKTGS